MDISSECTKLFRNLRSIRAMFTFSKYVNRTVLWYAELPEAPRGNSAVTGQASQTLLLESFLGLQ